MVIIWSVKSITVKYVIYEQLDSPTWTLSGWTGSSRYVDEMESKDQIWHPEGHPIVYYPL